MTEGDLDDVHAYQSREDVCRYLMFEPRTREEVAEKVAKHAAADTLAADGDYWQLAIERDGPRDRRPVLHDLERRERDRRDRLDAASRLRRAGLMSEAANAVLGIAFDASGCTG